MISTEIKKECRKGPASSLMNHKFSKMIDTRLPCHTIEYGHAHDNPEKLEWTPRSVCMLVCHVKTQVPRSGSVATLNEYMSHHQTCTLPFFPFFFKDRIQTKKGQRTR
jgi:hypothetical protein